MECDTVIDAQDPFASSVVFGTVPRMALEHLAELTCLVYGDAGHLLLWHSAFILLSTGLLPAVADALRERLLTGKGRAVQTPLRVWAAMRTGGIRICPECERLIWKRYGVCAYLWPHLVPFVQACPWHGCLLWGLSPSPVPRAKWLPVHAAHRDQVAYSQAALALTALGDRTRIMERLLGGIRSAGFLPEEGRFHTDAFSQEFRAMCEDLHVHPALRKLACLPLRGRQLLAAIVGKETVHPAFLLLLWTFLERRARCAHDDALPDRVVPRGGKQSSRPIRAWRANHPRALPVDGRHRYRRTDLPHLIEQRCSPAEIARLCRLTLDTVYRDINRLGLRRWLDEMQRSRIAEEARQIWLARTRAAPGASANQIANREPRLFRWLSRNDATWLHEHWPHASKPRSPRRRDTHGLRGQDASLVAEIRKAAWELEHERPGQRRTIAALRRQLGLSEYALRQASRAKRVRDALARYLLGSP